MCTKLSLCDMSRASGTHQMIMATLKGSHPVIESQKAAVLKAI